MADYSQAQIQAAVDAENARIQGRGTMADRADDYLRRRDQARQEEAQAAALASQQALARQQANMTPSQQAAARAQQELQGGLEAARFLDQSQRTVRVNNPMYRPTQRYLGETEAQQLIGREGAADEQIIRERQAQEVAGQMQDIQARDLAEQAVMQTRERARNERLNEQIANVRKADQAVSEAADKLSSTPGVDPGRHWASRSAGQKFAAFLSSVATGFAGGNAMEQLNTMIARDIDAQKNEQGMAQAALGARQAEAGNERSVYGEIMSEVQDERSADLIMEQARLEQAKRGLAAQAAKHGAEVLPAQHQQLLSEIDQRMAANKLNLERMQAANTPYSYKRVNTIGRNERKLLQQAAAQGVKLAGDLTRDSFKMAGQERRDTAQAQAKAAAAQQKSTFDQRRFVAEKTAAARNEIAAIDDFYEKYGGREGDIPGVSALPLGDIGRHQLTSDARAARAELKRIVMIRLRDESGAAISEEELERDAENILSGMSEEDVWNALDARRSEATRRVDLVERAPDEEVVEYYRRGMGPDFDPLADGDVADPTVVDE